MPGHSPRPQKQQFLKNNLKKCISYKIVSLVLKFFFHKHLREKLARHRAATGFSRLWQMCLYSNKKAGLRGLLP